MNNLVPQRFPVDDNVLWDWVEAEINTQITAKNTFTAYTITQLLRNKYPTHEIAHAEVQWRVHDMMEKAMNYDMTWEQWNGNPARTYFPIATTTVITIDDADVEALGGWIVWPQLPDGN